MEEDDDMPKRSTRGRNPLPPTVGPLFPPLPPKVPKQPGKNSPRSRPSPASKSPSVVSKRSASHHGRRESIGKRIDPEEEPQSPGPTTPPPDSPSKGKVNVPSGSVTSLTPPPPTSDDPANGVDAEAGQDAEDASAGGETTTGQSQSGGTAETSDDWDSYRRHRGVRSFGAANGEVKDEPGQEDEEDDEETPKKSVPTRASTRRSSQYKDDSADVSTSEAGASGSRHGRRRRGEEQLLMDDHLLPDELKRTGNLSGKRGKSQGRVTRRGDRAGDDGEGEEEDAGTGDADQAVSPSGMDEDMKEERPEAQIEDEGADGAEDGGDEIEDVTRCICKTDDADIMMIQCDECNVWQHGPCMGIWADEEAPDEYYCEQCRPDLHGPLRKWLRSRGRGAPAVFQPPTPEDLQKYHNTHDKHPPSQSKRWNDIVPRSPVQKPLARSHHRKDTGSPVDDKRARGARAQSGTSRSEKPVSANRRDSREPSRRGESSHHRRVSLGGVRSPSPRRSPSPGHAHAPPKRRSTMNSRDAAYEEEQFKAVLEASRKEILSLRDGDPKQRQADEDETESVATEKPVSRKGKRKAEDDEDVATAGPSSSKPKHPNQYTYRPKVLPSSSTDKPSTHRSTPVPALPPPAQHDHGTRRAGAIANGIIPPPPNSISVHNLHWHLPDHLSQFSDLLPAAAPKALESRAPRTMTYLSKNYYHNQRYGPFSDERDELGNLHLPDEPPRREPVNGPRTQLEPPARVRYPARRITTAEMKKRVRNVLEYVSRVQVEEGKRKDRLAQIGIIDPKTLTPPQRLDKDGDALMDEDIDKQDSVMVNQGPSSADMMDDLMRDLITFQETWANGGFSTPAMAPSEPLTPVIPSTSDADGGVLPKAPDVEVVNEDSKPNAAELAAGIEATAPGGEDTQSEDVPMEAAAESGPAERPAEPEAATNMEETADENAVIDAVENVEVYRAGEVDKVVTDQVEEEVAKDVEEAVGGDVQASANVALAETSVAEAKTEVEA